jgi:glycosyltransferase involved in cell wall biosynthesis
LLIVGDGPERSYLQALASKLLSEENYEFRAPVPAPEVISLMRQHAIYVLPSSGSEGWGAVINEAMASGCAVIASKFAGAAASIITHRSNGLLFEPGNWQELNSNLELLCASPSMRAAIASAGWQSVSSFWSPNVAAERFLEVSSALLRRETVPSYSNGPMSLA